jgi:hypothetical protein
VRFRAVAAGGLDLDRDRSEPGQPAAGSVRGRRGRPDRGAQVGSASLSGAGRGGVTGAMGGWMSLLVTAT